MAEMQIIDQEAQFSNGANRAVLNRANQKSQRSDNVPGAMPAGSGMYGRVHNNQNTKTRWCDGFSNSSCCANLQRKSSDSEQSRGLSAAGIIRFGFRPQGLSANFTNQSPQL